MVFYKVGEIIELIALIFCDFKFLYLTNVSESAVFKIFEIISNNHLIIYVFDTLLFETLFLRES